MRGVVVGRLPLDQSSHVLWSLALHVSGVGVGDTFVPTPVGVFFGPDGTKAPDLTHLAQRETIAALTVPNDRAHLRRWITDAQHFKPGALMPPIDLDDQTRDAIVDYLETLR